MLKKYLRSVLLIYFTFCLSNVFSQEYTDAEIKSAYIYNFCKNIKWPDEKNFNKFEIGIYGNDTSLISTLELFSRLKQIKNKDVELITYSNSNDIINSSPQVLVITNSKNSEIKELYSKFFSKKTLFVTDNCNKQLYIMINFISHEKDKISFEVNKATIEDQGLKVLPDLLLLGGTELDLKNLYKLQEEDLKLERERILDQIKKIQEQQKQIEKQSEIVASQNQEINSQKKQIETKKNQITEQQFMLSELLKKVKLQNENLLKKETVLNKQQKEISERETLISEQKEELKKGEEQLSQQKKKIAKGLKDLSKVEGELKVQKKFNLLMIFAIGLIVIFAIYIFINLRAKLKINRKLEKLNAELEKSQFKTQNLNEELASANEELTATNDQLFSQKEELEATLSQLKETQLQLVQSEKMASAGILTAGIAHEINNPLNFIQGGTYAIESYINNKAAEHKVKLDPLFKNINTGITRATDIISSLNHFSRQSENTNEICNIHSIIDDCLVMLNNQLKHKVIVNKDYTSSESIIQGNEGKLYQVFLNVIRNAEQSIEEKGEIFIKTELVKGVHVTKITDTGAGISKENLTKIMDPFFTTKEPGKGTGLGLSIVYTIIQEHKGIIKYDSEEGKGTTATISFPLK